VKVTVAVLNKKGENAVPQVIVVLGTVAASEDVCFSVATRGNYLAAKDLETLGRHEVCAPLALGCVASSAFSGDEAQLMWFEKSTAAAFDGTTYEPSKNVTPVLDLFARKMAASDWLEMAESFIKNVEGDYAFTIAEEGRFVSARDPIGVQPLFYGETSTIAALASNRKALWKLGVVEPKSFPPGRVAEVTKGGFKFKPVKTLSFQEPQRIGMAEAAGKLQTLLESSVQKRVLGVKKVAVAFSGGLDSSLVAFLAKKCGVDVTLVHVSLENQPETDEAVRAALELDLPLQVHLFKESDIERDIAKVVWLIEEADPVKAGVGLPFYWTAQKTAEAGLKVLLAGQGADELFGGYQRYVTEYIADGDAKVRRTMYNDVANVHESNLERDEKICIHHDVELRLPFATFEVAKFAMGLPTELKFDKKAGSLRKLVLRQAAERVGLPSSIVGKPKKAVQYSTGTSNALKRLAKKNKLSIVDYISNLLQEQRNQEP
jgi:asparagine synthase (glutamine-hydrolysing)